jgi:hypothetical protein
MTGRVVELGDGGLAVDLAGGERWAIEASGRGSVVTRAGTVARLADVRPGDDVRITLEGTTGEALRIDATPPAADGRSWIERFGWLAAPLLIGLAAVVFARRRVGSASVLRGSAVSRSAHLARSVAERPMRALLARRRTWVFWRRPGATIE